MEIYCKCDMYLIKRSEGICALEHLNAIFSLLKLNIEIS